MPEHILSLSYGKDSLACLGAIEQLGWPLDRIVHAEVWATDTIPADLPPMVEFKAKADRIIRERWGIEVEHVRSKYTFESGFYTLVGQKAKPEYRWRPRGWAGIVYGNWCNRDLKQPAFREANKQNGIYYIGIAADEPARARISNGAARRRTDMERLTVFDGEFWIHKNFPPIEEERVDEFIDCVKELAARLAAIEDILGDEYDLERLRELVQAKRERRCVVLPCKIGDPVWRLYDDCDFPGDCYTKQKCRGCEYRNLFIEEQAFCLSMLCQNGKLAPPYYTIRAEAEAALRREQE